MRWWPMGMLPVIYSANTDSNSFTPEENLTDNSQFGWMVTANDIHGAESNSDSSYFYTDSIPEPPMNFTTIAPEKEVEGIIEGDDRINIETGTLTTNTKPVDLKLNTKGIGYYEKGNDVPIRTIPLDKINSIKYGSEKHEGDKHYITIKTSENKLKGNTYILKDKEDENKVEIVYKKLKGLLEMYLVYLQITSAGGAMAGGGSVSGAIDTSDELQINYTEINDFINNFMLYFRNRVRDYDDTLNSILIEYFVNILENLFNFKNNNIEWDTEYKGMIETNTLNIIDISDNIVKIPTYIYLSKNDINIIIKYLEDIGEDVSRLDLLFKKIYG